MKRTIIITLITLPTLINAQNQEVITRIANFLNVEAVVIQKNIKKTMPPYTIPLIKANTEEVYQLPWDLSFNNNIKKVYLYFSLEGDFIRGESVDVLANEPW